MIKEYICENLYVVTIHYKVKIYFKMIQIITKHDEIFIHIWNVN
jgi:hypothetical protein